MDNTRERIECINFRSNKTNILNNSVYLLIKTTKRRFEFNVNIKCKDGFVYDIVISGDPYYMNFVGSRLYDFIIDNNEMTFYTNIGKFSVILIKKHRNVAVIPKFMISENGKEIWNKEI